MNTSIIKLTQASLINSLSLQWSAALTSQIHTSAPLCRVVSGKYRITKKRDRPLTYEMANPPHYIAHRKSWNSWNTSSLKDGLRRPETALEDEFIRRFMTGTWHGLVCSENRKQANGLHDGKCLSLPMDIWYTKAADTVQPGTWALMPDHNSKLIEDINQGGRYADGEMSHPPGCGLMCRLLRQAVQLQKLVIVKRQFNHIRVAAIIRRAVSPTKMYFLLGYTEELLANWLQCPVTLELQTVDSFKDVVFKYI